MPYPPHDRMISSAMRKLSRLISVMRLITGIPAPKIHRRTLINREDGTGEAGGTRRAVTADTPPRSPGTGPGPERPGPVPGQAPAPAPERPGPLLDLPQTALSGRLPQPLIPAPAGAHE